MNGGNLVGWFEIYVTDMERAKKFYGAVFQRGEFEELSVGQEQILAFPGEPDGPYSSGALVKAEQMVPGEGGTVVYFHCLDCQIEEDRVVPAGGTAVKPKFSIGEFGFVSIVKDTEGNLIGLHSRA